MLSACSSLDIILPKEDRPAPAGTATQTSQTKSVKSGGYYLDDGPPIYSAFRMPHPRLSLILRVPTNLILPWG